jgi:hypothetical protein
MLLHACNPQVPNPNDFTFSCLGWIASKSYHAGTHTHTHTLLYSQTKGLSLFLWNHSHLYYLMLENSTFVAFALLILCLFGNNLSFASLKPFKILVIATKHSPLVKGLEPPSIFYEWALGFYYVFRFGRLWPWPVQMWWCPLKLEKVYRIADPLWWTLQIYKGHELQCNTLEVHVTYKTLFTLYHKGSPLSLV